MSGKKKGKRGLAHVWADPTGLFGSAGFEGLSILAGLDSWAKKSSLT